MATAIAGAPRPAARRQDIDHLSAIAPAIAQIAPGHPGDEPAIAVTLSAEDRRGATPPAFRDPVLRHHLPSCCAPACRIGGPEGQQGSRAHRHLVAAQIDALRVAFPAGDPKARDRVQPVARQIQRGPARDAGQDRRHQMRRGGGILHPAAGLPGKTGTQRHPHPVAAGDPAAVIRSRLPFQSRLHRQQVAKRHTRQARVGFGRQVRFQQRRDGLIRPLQISLVHSDASQRRNDRFRGGLDVRRTVRGVFAIAARRDLDPVAPDRDGPQPVHGRGLGQDRGQAGAPYVGHGQQGRQRSAADQVSTLHGAEYGGGRGMAEITAASGRACRSRAGRIGRGHQQPSGDRP